MKFHSKYRHPGHADDGVEMARIGVRKNAMRLRTESGSVVNKAIQREKRAAERAAELPRAKVM